MFVEEGQVKDEFLHGNKEGRKEEKLCEVQRWVFGGIALIGGEGRVRGFLDIRRMSIRVEHARGCPVPLKPSKL